MSTLIRSIALEEEERSLDPLSDHKLMLQKVSDMTGYEYQRYLRLIKM